MFTTTGLASEESGEKKKSVEAQKKYLWWDNSERGHRKAGQEVPVEESG